MISSNCEIINFKNQEEKPVNIRATNPPQCIQDLPPQDTGRVNLNDEQLAQAMSQLVNKGFTSMEWPRTMKLHVDPPLSGQNFTLLSFIPSKTAVPDKEGCFGVLKIRGTFPSEKEMDQWAENIIRNHDTYAAIDCCYVGKPFPLMKDNSVYRESTKEIDTRIKVNEIQKEEVKTRRDQERKEMDEVNRRHRELLSSVEETKEKTVDDLELYTQLRVKKANLLYRQEDFKKRIIESEQLLVQTVKEISSMDKQHPEYKEQFMTKYLQALDASGIDPSKNPLIELMKD